MDTARIAQSAHLDTRELRALELHRTRGHEIRKVGEDLYLVPSCTGRGSSTVDYRVEACDCPDFRNRGLNCKHILAVGIRVAKRRSSAARPCACIGGAVFVGYIDDHGVERQASYRCRRCAGEAR
jgi:SWIM zinc finger